MGYELNEKRRQLIEQERLRREEEVERRLLEAENERKSRELEEAREFQLSLLPKELPAHPALDVAVHMQTATEVGGDYYDFFPMEAGALTAVIGDATGHGAKAGTMVTVIKGLLTAGAGQSDLTRILGDATRAIKSMDLGRMNMAVTLVRIRGERITISAAGMPPVLLFRQRTGRVEEVDLPGTPLGSLSDVTYKAWESSLAPGDTLLLLSDGFPELLSGDGEPLGYPRARSCFEASARKPATDIIADLSATARDWNGGQPPDDDITFVVLKMKAA
jgi:serine phosphatase RsbU (regulator of sigma subunit)